MATTAITYNYYHSDVYLFCIELRRTQADAGHGATEKNRQMMKIYEN